MPLHLATDTTQYTRLQHIAGYGVMRKIRNENADSNHLKNQAKCTLTELPTQDLRWASPFDMSSHQIQHAKLYGWCQQERLEAEGEAKPSAHICLYNCTQFTYTQTLVYCLPARVKVGKGAETPRQV